MADDKRDYITDINVKGDVHPRTAHEATHERVEE
jgi:hypothetical protein